MADHIICNNPNCSYRGEATAVARGSRVVLVLLLLLWILPGIIYLLFFTGWDNYCPRCNLFLGRGRSGPSTMGANALLVFIALLAAAFGVAMWASTRDAEPQRRSDPVRLDSPPSWSETTPQPHEAADAGAPVAPRPRRRHSRGQ